MSATTNRIANQTFMLVRLLPVAGLLLCALMAHAQPPLPPDPDIELCTWSFDDTNWLSDLGYPPLSFTNLNDPPSFDGNALQMDTNVPAWLQHRIVETDDAATNLTFDEGTIELWFLPDWNSGEGPGEWGRLIDVGAYSTNNPSSWWSLYFTPDGNNLYFSSETNGVFTNYLNVPISWDTNTWHFLALTYRHPRTELYIDGQLATNGAGMDYQPDPQTISNGFYVGSDLTGSQQSRGLIDDLATYNYGLDPYEVSNDYEAGLQVLNGGGFHRDDGGPPSPGGGGGGSGSWTNSPEIPPDYGTNLWIAQVSVASNLLTAIASNTVPDVLYEVQSITQLTQTNWQSLGFFNGSELTNWTALFPFPVSQTNNLYIRLKSWADSTGTGIPDWWWLQFFSQTTTVDAFASDPAGDGYTDLQKFQMGVNPLLYYNPNGPPGFFGYLDSTGTNVFLAWGQAAGPVTGYVIQRGIQGTNGNYAYSQIGLVSSNATFFEDAGAINNSNALNDVYNLQAVYPGGSLSVTDTWYVSWSPFASEGPPYGPPSPTNFYAYADATATNILLSWSPASSVATNYLIERGILNTDSNAYIYQQIASINPGTNSFEVRSPFTNEDNWSDSYAVVAVYPGGGQAAWAYSSISVGFPNGPSAPSAFYGYADTTGTNLVLAWTPAGGTPTNYAIFGGTFDYDTGNYGYVHLGTVNGSTNSLVITNGMNNLFEDYAVFAGYTNGSFSQAATWMPDNGTPAPADLVAYLDSTGTNVLLLWNAPAGTITGYVIQRSDDYGYSGSYHQLATLGVGTNVFENVGAVDSGSFSTNATAYKVQATLPGGGLSSAAIANVSAMLPSPSGLSAVVDSTGTNVLLTWYAPWGAATNYIIERGVLNPATGLYSFSPIATVGPATTSFTDSGVITSADSYNNQYEIEAVYPGDEESEFDESQIVGASAGPQANLYLAAKLVRNQTGRWQVMFSGLSTNTIPMVQLMWEQEGYVFSQQSIWTASLTNSVYQIPDAEALSLLNDTSLGVSLDVQPVGQNGSLGQVVQAGEFANDAPYFVNGSVHMKQNLDFLIRAASIYQPFFSISNAFDGQFNQTATSFEEFSFLHHSGGSGIEDYGFNFQLDDLWPFSANYEMVNYLVDTSRGNAVLYGSTNFTFEPDFTNNIPAPPVLNTTASYWMLQPGVTYYLGVLNYDYQDGEPPGNWGVTLTDTNTTADLATGDHNLYGLPYTNGCIISTLHVINNGYEPFNYQAMSPGGSVTSPEAEDIYDYASGTPAPMLVFSNYYFAPLIDAYQPYTEFTDGLVLPGEFDATGGSNVQPFPLPIDDDFNVTNRTPSLLIGTIGQPMILGGWAKYSIQNGSTPTGKFGYLGQYFETNAFLLNSDGSTSTNSAGILSPYGEFLPLQAGAAALVTMPDIDSPYEQGTGIVRSVSMNVDANHDGVMDFSYSGPDQNSPSRPYRFWVNDDQDSGDFGGNFGIPGLTPAQGADGSSSVGTATLPAPLPNGITTLPVYHVHGRRDLVDYFPVYLNIKSLFQSNVLSAGIGYTDTNYEFVLTQADGALNFCYTDLTPTNYMNFLQDTNESGQLADYTNVASLAATLVWPVTPYRWMTLSQSFIANIATNNGGIILVEASAPTTQPLVLTIYHGTNQIAQTSLYLSISGVEQMFRHKNLLLYSSSAVPDRLTDADVPNEPDTIDKNFVFMHGYNVNPNEARGVAADMYKRMYWSGSHAKFWAVTWEGADSKIGSIFTPNYHTNVVNAFNTAPLLANFIASLTNSGPVVAAAHSLGNMLTLSAISDWQAPISQYFMMDSAVPIEAIDPASTNVSFMTFSTWAGYSNRLFTAYWCQLFPTNDARSTLSWNNRLGNLGNVDVYNFYSSGEEVLRLTAGDPPLSTINILATQIINYSSLFSLWPDVPFGTYSWYWQEKGKGTCNEDGLIGSSHGGWKFSTYWVDSYGNPLSPAIMNGTTNTILQTQPMFNFSSTANSSLEDVDIELLGSVPEVNPSTYAATYRNRILSDAIPAMSLVVGANPVPSFDDNHNKDMQSLFENGWSAGRPQLQVGNPAAGEWHHSDFVQMAYTFTYKLFNQFVSTGNLK